MIDRILAILKLKNLSPAQFADMINVQRSSISHLISGRNKPSLEFIQKMLNTFPDINTDWLIFGNGTMIQGEKTNQNKIVPSSNELLFQEEKLDGVSPIINIPASEKVPEIKKQEVEKVQKRKQIETEGRKIEKIVWFYNDHTFREYFPEQG
jgi:transcriptional regulator with XRE-family HTH domain